MSQDQSLERQGTNSAALAHEPSMMEVIARAAADSKVDVAKMEQLLAMKERIDAREAENAFHRAMKAAQEGMQPVIRDAQNEHSHSKYARLETIDKSIRPVYTLHGFAVTFNSPELTGDTVSLSCSVLHDAGHSRDYNLKGPLDCTGAKGAANKTGIQGLGSSISYLRRYLTCMIFNIVLTNEDDDGQIKGFVTDQQADSILDMIQQCVTTRDDFETVKSGFLKYMGAKLVGEIHARDYRKAITALENKRRKSAEGR